MSEQIEQGYECGCQGEATTGRCSRYDEEQTGEVEAQNGDESGEINHTDFCTRDGGKTTEKKIQIEADQQL